MDKYDEAIAFLKSVEPGSYFDECAALMEELVALAHHVQATPDQAYRRGQSFGAEAWYRRNCQRPSSAMLNDE